MMRNMRGPEQTADMVYPVQPVIHKIFEYEQHDPVYPGIFDWLHKAVVIEKRKDEADVNDAEQQIDTPVEQHEINILRCVLKRVGLLFA
jgi:hypothetical protein